MKLIKRTTLGYQEGRSDKVYEVDLCQTGEDRYVVNFRYGRRGTNLKEGTKTVAAVPLTEAQRVFDKLVASKIKEGYRDNTVPISDAPVPVPTKSEDVSVTGDARKQAILNRLANRNYHKWPMERVIWRAGELKISEATPLLIPLIGTGDALRDYCIAAALGWCGGKGAIPALIKLYQNSSTPEFVNRIAFEALLKLSDEPTRLELQSEIIELLPEQLRPLARNGSEVAFSTALRTYLESGDYRNFAVIDIIYQINNQLVRPALLEILRTAPFKPNYFQRIRHIFKMAEYRLDAEVFGILVYRFEKESAMYRSNDYYLRLPDGTYLRKYEYRYDNVTRRYKKFEKLEFQQELQRPDARVAYSSNTSKYLVRRLWRKLNSLGEFGDANYITMAVSVLLQYSDADAEPVKLSTFYRWHRPGWTRTSFSRNWDAYAGYLTFNHILYENSPRYVLMPNSQGWRCRESYQPGNPEPDVREEAFPQLWEQHPEALLQLLKISNCYPVHHFAVKALRVCQQFCAQIDIDSVIQLVNKPYEVTAQLAFELASSLYNPANPRLELILALANCSFQPARTQAYQWIEELRDRFLNSSNYITALVTSQHSDTRQFARRLLTSSILSDTTARVLIGRIIAALLALEPTETQMAKEIGETLLVSFTPQLRNLGFGVILDLLQHPMPQIKELGAQILLNHETRAVDLPSEVIDFLLNSPYEPVRVIGVRIFGQLPDEMLLNRYELLLGMATHELADMRTGIRPVIRRLGIEYPDFVARMVTELINVLMTPEKHEGIHSNLVRILGEDLPGWMSGITKEATMQLLKAESSAAQELGGLVLSSESSRFLTDFEIIDIVKLANHEIFSVREAARQMFLKSFDRIRASEQEMLSAVRLLESKWEDSREFAFRVFHTEFTDADFTPYILVSICDSIRENVRQFGRDLVTRNFQQSYGQDYLLKFSEHPSADMQMFVTNYLKGFAVDNPERLEQLIPYFVTVLSGVNRGGVAKERIFAFLDAEAQKSEAAARVVAEILSRQSVTLVIGDKANAIQIMLKIRRLYPEVPLPIRVKSVSLVESVYD